MLQLDITQNDDVKYTMSLLEMLFYQENKNFIVRRIVTYIEIISITVLFLAEEVTYQKKMPKSEGWKYDYIEMHEFFSISD